MIDRKKISVPLRITILLIFLFLLAGTAGFFVKLLAPKDMGADYTETAETIENPERGFYHLRYFSEGIEPSEVSGNLLVIRAGLGEFSDNYLIRAYGNAEGAETASEEADSSASDTGESVLYTENGYSPISEEYLSALSAQLALCREKGTPVILRFAYDNYAGWADCEPSMEGITEHIGQLKSIFQEYEDVICGVESGLLGPFGEQHSSAIVTQENINTMLDALLDAVPESIPVSVRRPSYYAGYVGITEEELADYRAEEGSPYYRIGIYNDGYLGTFSDFGTFADRDSFNAWMSYQGGHTLYGSEATVSDDPDYLDWTYVDGICEEMFLTHTSYLNPYFNSRVMDRWKASEYTGDDPVYAGKTVYEYVENHLGYRYVLKKAEYTKFAGTFRITFEIGNVGAGNSVKERKVTLIAVDGNGTAEAFPQDFDVRKWESGEVTKEIAKVDLSGLTGEIKIYLRVEDDLGNSIRFSNGNNEFSEKYGNYCGSIFLRGNEAAD